MTSTHVLVPAAQYEGLADLAHRTRIQQSVYLREAVGDLMERYATGVRVGQLPEVPPQEQLRSLVFRVKKSALKAVRELAAKTRIRQSELLREALADLLAKHEDSPKAAP